MSGLDFVTGSLLSEDVLHQLAQSPELTRSRHGPEQDIEYVVMTIFLISVSVQGD